MKQFIVFLALCISINFAFTQTWTSLSSPTGFKNVRDFTVNNTGVTLYAADELSLLKSTDTGKSWSATGSVIAGSRAVTTKWDNTNIVLASGSSFFKRSTNGGSSWTDIETGSPNKPLALASFSVAGEDSKVMLLGRKQHNASFKAIDRSVDSGATWTPEMGSATTVFDIGINGGSSTGYAVAAGCPTDAQTVKGIYHTTNYGATWTSTMTGSSYVGWTAVALYKAATVDTEWAGTADGKVYVGAFDKTLTQKTSFPTNGDTIRAIRINPNNRRIVFVATDRTVYKTTDGGANWSIVTTGMLDSRSSALEMNSGNANILHSGTRGYIYRSADAASNWTEIASTATRTLPTSSIAPFSYAVTPFTIKAWSASNDLTITSTYNGSSWNTLRLGDTDDIFLGVSSNAFLNGSGAKHIFQTGAIDKTSAVYLSSDSGGSYSIQGAFTTSVTGTSCKGFVVDPGRPQKVFAFGLLKDGSNDRNYFTNDSYGVSTWDKATGTLDAAKKWLAMAPLGDANPSSYIYAGVEGAGLRRSTNGGGSWPPVGSISTSATGKAFAFNKNVVTTIYAGVTSHIDSGLWLSINANGGTPTFTKKWSTAGVKKAVIDPRATDAQYSSAHLFWVGTNNTIYSSVNGGTSATAVNGNLPAGTIVNDLRTDPSDTKKLYIATDKGVYSALLVEAPATLSSPANSATNVLYCASADDPLVFSWSSATGATSYQIQIDDNSNFSSPRYDEDGVSNPYNRTVPIGCDTTWHWRVRSNDGFGKSPWSPSFSFTTLSCAADSLLVVPTGPSPASGATGVSLNVTLSWTAVSGAVAYKVVVDGFTTKYTTTNSVFIGGLSENTTYYWHVKALNCNVDNPSSSWNFRTCTNCPMGPGGPGGSNSPLVGNAENDGVTEYSLAQNFPNPFNPVTIFEYALPEAGHVILRIFNPLGQEVNRLVDGYEFAGRKSVKFDAGELPTGVYFYRLDAGSFHSIKKMLFVK